ncbi:hypothetical protein QAD02_001076 [Eretmocerus hayati]|uniref:Uncharacterized protein n=1 Tax=Eretmocerus hayati TaxID=131215 RepID=A0ACC2NFE1_9HYME|nr:hypothetical protein QAD02_001076 [Eretmocerus hayati]
MKDKNSVRLRAVAITRKKEKLGIIFGRKLENIQSGIGERPRIIFGLPYEYTTRTAIDKSHRFHENLMSSFSHNMRKLFNNRSICTALILYIFKSHIMMVNTLNDEGTRAVLPNEFPSYATLGEENLVTNKLQITCSGVLITGIFVLSTTNCAWRAEVSRARIVFGKVRRSELNLDYSYRIDWRKSYSEWASEQNQPIEPDLSLNIALIRLSERVQEPKLALLPFDIDFPRGDVPVSLVGWTKALGGYILKTADVTLKSKNSMSKYELRPYQRYGEFPDFVEGKLLCTETELQMGKFDEGGPLFYNRRVLMGLNRYRGHCQPRQRMFHINTVYYKAFITYFMDSYE